ncbi:MAG TPA: UDP-glucose 6-dehydrogenase [Acidimicrobiaceae bacterium]|nr:UDP-glucose 6-dehydrogenase [Acidimicrobiaceae bacterium]
MPDDAAPADAAPPGSILVVGAGYVGLTAAACFAHLGHRVVCSDIDAARIADLAAGIAPAHEPDLAGLVSAGLASGRLSFVVDAAPAAAQSEFAFLCVPTPLGDDGSTDTTHLLAAAAELGRRLAPGAVVVSKSTIPVGGHEAVVAAVARDDVAVVSNPEFLAEGSAVADFLTPDRIVVGAHDDAAAARVAALYDGVEAPVVLTDPASAATIKYAANSFLATKVSFVNALTAVCDAVGADIDDVLAGVGADRRIGAAYMAPGPGWGGSCLPKDTRALVSAAGAAGYVFDLLEGAIRVNEQQIQRVVDKIVAAVGPADGSLAGASDGRLAGKTVALLGLTFKAGTDDLRGSPALTVARRLAGLAARLRVHDPAVPPSADVDFATAAAEIFASAEEALRGAEVAVVLTEWPEFAALDWAALAGVMAAPRVVDARNLLDPAAMRAHGFAYEGLGRRPESGRR